MRLHDMPYNAELIQWFITLSGVPTTSENVVIRRMSTVAPNFDLYIVDQDISVAGLTYIVCNEIWQFRRTDRVVFGFPNTDDQTVTMELVFREVP